MKFRSLLFGGSLITLMTAVITAIYYSQLPEQIATHWNARGEIDQYSSKMSGLMLVPLMQVGMLILFIVLPSLSPDKAKIDSFIGSYNTVCLYVLGFMGFVQITIIKAALGGFDVSKAIIVGVLILMALIGNLLTKTRRNYWMGIRTPWTLESEEVWTLTHRFAGRSMVLGSAIGILMVIVGIQFMPVFVVLMVSCLLPVPYSYLIYRRRRGNLL